jgi:Flp pilus assembly protein TadG
MHRLIRNRERASGQTLVEFALILPIFVLMLVGVFDVGRAIYTYSTINNAAHEAVRLAIVDQNTTDVRDRAISQSVGVNVAPGDVTVRWLDAAYADAAPCNATPRYGCTVEVTVQYAFTAATPIISNLMGTINLEGVARQPIERTFTSP